MRKAVLYLSIFLLLISSVYAAGLEVELEILEDKIEAGGTGQFVLTIKNSFTREQLVKVSADPFSVTPFSPIVDLITIDPAQFYVPAWGEKQVAINVKYLKNIEADKTYYAYVNVVSLTSEIEKKIELPMFLISSKETIDVQMNIPSEVIPGINMPFSVTFKNRANKDFENLDVFVTSPVFSDKTKLNLKAHEAISTNLNFKMPASTEPGEYSLNVRIFDGEDIRGIGVGKFRIVENPQLSEREVVDRGFLKTTITISLSNKGNSEMGKRIKHTASFFRLFTSTEPEAKIEKIEGKRYYIWDVSAKPNETVEVKIITSYRILFAIIVLVGSIIALFVYWRKKSVIIVKKLFKVREEEGKSELKILLHVTNNTNNPIHNLKVIDFLPNLINPLEDFATIKPEKIQRGSSGLRVVWSIPILEPGEERIISYKVESKLPVIGVMSLPAASAQYRGTKDKVITVSSRRLAFALKSKLY